MTEPTRPDGAPDNRPAVLFPKGLGLAIVVLLTLQLALGYVQGALLHRQQEELRSLRADIQELAEAIDQGQGAMDGGQGEGEPWRRSRSRARQRTPARLLAARHVLDGDEDDRARKELQQSTDSARKAVNDARKAEKQLSITENIRKADEQQRLNAAQNQWQKWALAALGLAVLGFLARGWIRNRG